MTGLKAGFRRFLEADPERLHFAAHSHHPWPDATYDAQIACWQDAADLADLKWTKVFGEVVPAVQSQIAALLELSEPASLAFGPNTHGFVVRLLSCLPHDRPLRVLSTGSEFHSLTRQMRRLEEDGLARVTWIESEPFADFAGRFAEAALLCDFDLVYFSHVFYDSGHAIADLEGLIERIWRPGRFVVVDGYHGFTAVPSNLAALENRVFYLAGGYKYAMAGEGACFLHVPANLDLRPRDSGWLAEFQALEADSNEAVSYGPGGARFLGATFDPVGLYRLRAALGWLEDCGLTVEARLNHCQKLQEEFIDGLAALNLECLRPEQLVVPLEDVSRGHFLTFRTSAARALQARLQGHKVITDARGDRLRFGFGIYQDQDDVARLCRALAEILD
ncbi:MAG: aminotransferase class V-fold PLP-dependent enzyme [Pseudomonadota bacterium]